MDNWRTCTGCNSKKPFLKWEGIVACGGCGTELGGDAAASWPDVEDRDYVQCGDLHVGVVKKIGTQRFVDLNELADYLNVDPEELLTWTKRCAVFNFMLDDYSEDFLIPEAEYSAWLAFVMDPAFITKESIRENIRIGVAMEIERFRKITTGYQWKFLMARIKRIDPIDYERRWCHTSPPIDVD